jgi:hypothetical protein
MPCGSRIWRLSYVNNQETSKAVILHTITRKYRKHAYRQHRSGRLRGDLMRCWLDGTLAMLCPFLEYASSWPPMLAETSQSVRYVANKAGLHSNPTDSVLS